MGWTEVRGRRKLALSFAIVKGSMMPSVYTEGFKDLLRKRGDEGNELAKGLLNDIETSEDEDEAAAKIIEGMRDAAHAIQKAVPEAFDGYPEEERP